MSWSGVRPLASVVVHNFKHEYLCNQWADRNQILSEALSRWGKAALSFWPDQIRTLVAMATESSHRVIMEKTVSPLFLGGFFNPILSILAGNDDMHESSDEVEFLPARTTDCGLSCH